MIPSSNTPLASISPGIYEADAAGYTWTFDQSTGIPAAYAELAGATHFTPVGDAGGFRGPATAWARWQLADDTNGRGLFVGASCGLCTSADWEYEANSRLQDQTPPSTTTTSTPGGTTTTTTEPPAGECTEATNAVHLQAGRAERRIFLIRAVGSGDLLGFSFQTTTLRQTAPGTWDRVDSCDA